CADPDDDAPRLIFADWLDEHGEAAGIPDAAARAEFIRVQIALAHGVEDEERRALLEARQSGLIEQHGGDWEQPASRLRDAHWHRVFRRGFQEDATVLHWSAFESQADILFTEAPT